MSTLRSPWSRPSRHASASFWEQVKVAEKSNEIRVDKVPIAIDRPIRVAPATMNLEVGFVDVPALTRAASCAVTPLAQRLTHHGQQLHLHCRTRS